MLISFECYADIPLYLQVADGDMVDISRSVIVVGVLCCLSLRYPRINALLDTVLDHSFSFGRSHPGDDNSFAIIISLRQVHLQANKSNQQEISSISPVINDNAGTADATLSLLILLMSLLAIYCSL